MRDFYERKVSGSMYECAQLQCDLEIKSLQEDGCFAGYASVFDVVDNQRDVVLRGAFRQTVQGRVDDIKMLWQHDVTEPIGYFTTMFEDERGLYVEGQLMLEVERAREAYALLKQGVLQGMSIGYRPVRYSVDPDSGVRQLKQVELFEVSLVTFPANAASGVTVVKAGDSGQWFVFGQALDRALGALVYNPTHHTLGLNRYVERKGVAEWVR